MRRFRSRLPLAAGLWLACALPAQAEIKLTDWLFYSMYSGDTAHSVHLSALKLRPDGLLESASRYPRHPDEPWTKEESDIGWYNYVPRLIDCETGFSIATGNELLDADGKSIARRDSAAQSLAEWKDWLGNELRDHKWPSNSEFFLACAGAADDKLLAARHKLAQTPPPKLSYTPLIATLRRDTAPLFERQTWHYEADLSKPGAPATPGELFDDAIRSYDVWLAAFIPGHKTSAPAATAAQAGLSENIQRWLNDQGVHAEAVSSRGDGTIEYVDREPQTFDVPYEVLDQRPEAAADATKASLLVRVDCRSGVEVAQRLDWLDEKNQVLATQPLPVATLATNLSREVANRENGDKDFAAAPPMNSVPQHVCRAVAAQCAGIEPGRLSPFSLSNDATAAIEKAPTAADALLALRAAYRSYRQHFVPTCRIGTDH